MTVYVLEEYDRHADTVLTVFSTRKLAMSRALVLLSTLDEGTIGADVGDGVEWYAYDSHRLISIHETTLIEE